MDIPDFKAVSKMLPGASLDEGMRASESQVDNSIDQDHYYIGGSDVFQISVVESPSIQYTGTVNENCDVYIPELGIIKIGKTTLAHAKKIIADFVGSKLRKQLNIYVSLVKTKTALVTVSGAVVNPGTYKLSGTYRLLDAIKIANNNSMPAYNENNYREIECLNKDSVRTYDLFKFLFANDLTQNPYVYPGDNIRLSLANRRVFIAGSIKTQVSGLVPIKQDEPIADFLSCFTFDESADSDHIIVQRVGKDNASVEKILSLRQPEAFFLQDRDLVIVAEKENYPQVLMVSVRGEVTRAGYYPIVKNSTRADDIVRLAGGPTKVGNPERAYVIRHKKILAEELNQNYGSPKPSMNGGMNDNSVRPEVNSGYSRMNSLNDFSILRLKDHKDGILLDNDDEIVVPKKEYCVYVSGSVRHPGAYDFNPTGSCGYYINQAGGYSSKADKANTFVVTYYGTVVQVKEKGSLEEGDVIVVPDSQQYKFLSMVFIPILSAIALTISTILALYTNMHK